MYDKIPYYLVSGTPGDCVALGLFKLMDKRPDMVISGINIGENVSILEFFMSGTMAGAIAASLYGVPAIAFSKVVPGKDVMIVEEVREEFDKVADIAKMITLYFLKNGLPNDSDLLSVNFPSKITKNTKIKITRLARISLAVRVYERDDPRGTPYYWILGNKFGSFPSETDALETLVNGNISITPIRLEGLSISSFEEFDRIESELNDVLGSVLDE
jgi:5'-nucleotidase